MRAHGEPYFPDPSATGGFTIPTSIDEHDSIFRLAESVGKSLQLGVPSSSGI